MGYHVSINFLIVTVVRRLGRNVLVPRTHALKWFVPLGITVSATYRPKLQSGLWSGLH